MSLTPQFLRANADVFRALLKEPPFETLRALAKHLGRDEANIRKTIVKLRQEGLVHAETLAPAKGLAELVAELGDPPPDPGPPVDAERDFLAAALWESPLNPRKTQRPQEEKDDLAASIQARGILQKPMVRPDGQVIFGWGRIEAVQHLVRTGDWPADKPIRCVVRDVSDAEHVRLAMLENIQRTDMNHLDFAEGIMMSMRLEGISAAEAARQLGKKPRNAQNHVRIAQGATEEEKAAFRAGDLNWEQVSEAVEARARAKPPELDPGARLLLAEVAHKSGWDTTAPHGERTLCAPWALMDTADGALQTLHGYDLLDGPYEDPSDAHVYVQITVAGANWLRGQMPEIGLEESRDAALRKVMRRLSAAFVTGQYCRSWLNGPFDPTPEALVRLEAARIALAEPPPIPPSDAARRWAHLRQDAAFRLHLDRIREDPAAAPTELRALFEDFGVPLPWSSGEPGELGADANGEPITADRLTFAILAEVLNALGAADLRRAAPEDPEIPNYLRRLAGVKEP